MTSPAEYVSTLHTRPWSWWQTLLERLKDLVGGAFGSFGYKPEPPAPAPVEQAPKVLEAKAEIAPLTITLSSVRARIEAPNQETLNDDHAAS